MKSGLTRRLKLRVKFYMLMVNFCSTVGNEPIMTDNAVGVDRLTLTFRIACFVTSRLLLIVIVDTISFMLKTKKLTMTTPILLIRLLR